MSFFKHHFANCNNFITIGSITIDPLLVLIEVITDYKSNYPAEICNPQIRWDTLKCVIRGYTIQYSSQKRRRLLMKQKLLIGTKNAIVAKSTGLLFA